MSDRKYTQIEPEFKKTFIGMPIDINFTAMAFPTIPILHPDQSSLKVMASMLTQSFLHREIREKGGAYGARASFLNFFLLKY